MNDPFFLQPQKRSELDVKRSLPQYCILPFPFFFYALEMYKISFTLKSMVDSSKINPLFYFEDKLMTKNSEMIKISCTFDIQTLAKIFLNALFPFRHQFAFYNYQYPHTN